MVRGPGYRAPDIAAALASFESAAAPVPYQRLAAYAVLRRDDEVLLTRVSALGHHAGAWTLPGGDVHSVHFTGRSPSGRLEDFHGVHLIFDAEVASAHLDPRVMESDGSTDAVAWIGRAVIDRGDVRVLDVVRHALQNLR